MTMRVRETLILLLVITMMSLAGCGGHYFCSNGATFGSSCTSSGSGLGGGGTGGGGGGGGGTAPTAFAFAVDQGGTMDGYALSTTAGTFAAVSGFSAPTIPASDPGVGMVVAQEKFVYTVFELQGAIYGWSMNSTTGALTALSGFPMTLALNAPIVAYNKYNIATNPTGTLLFVSDTGANQIFVYQIGSTGALTPVTGSPFPTTIEPGNLATDGLGKYLYVTEAVGGHSGAVIDAYSIGSTAPNVGVLTAVPGNPFPFAMWQVQGDASGNYLIGTTGSTAFYGAPGPPLIRL